MPDTDSERTTEKDLEALDAIVDIVRREGEDAVTTLCQIHAELEDAGYDLDPVEEAASHPNLESLFNTIMPCIVPADTDPPDDAAIMMQAQAAANSAAARRRCPPDGDRRRCALLRARRRRGPPRGASIRPRSTRVPHLQRARPNA